MMHVMALCSGAGGLEAGLSLADPTTRTICWVEREALIATSLVARMEAGDLPQAPIHSDLTTFDGHGWAGAVHLLSAGFPCQPFSLAGHGRAADDPRHLWPHVVRVLDETEAPLLFFENVRGLVQRGLRDVLQDLADRGFDAEWGCYSAAETGAPHQRDRIFCLAANTSGRAILEQRWGRSGSRWQGSPPAGWYGQDGAVADTGRPGLEGRDECQQELLVSPRRSSAVADTGREGQLQQGGPQPPKRRRPSNGGISFPAWPSEPGVGRVAHGVAYRAHKLRALGNGVVPRVAALSFTDLVRRLL